MAHILIIEPDLELGGLYKRTLDAAGYSVTLATSGQQALDAADTQVPNLVILELQLPGRGGLEFLYEFRSYPEWMEIPVIVQSMTAPRAMTDVKDALESTLGVGACVYKPRTTLASLLKLVKQQVTA